MLKEVTNEEMNTLQMGSNAEEVMIKEKKIQVFQKIFMLIQIFPLFNIDAKLLERLSGPKLKVQRSNNGVYPQLYILRSIGMSLYKNQALMF